MFSVRLSELHVILQINQFKYLTGCLSMCTDSECLYFQCFLTGFMSFIVPVNNDVLTCSKVIESPQDLNDLYQR